MDCDDPPRPAVAPVSSLLLLRPRILPCVPGAPDRGEGPEDAIRIAEAVGMPLRIAAKIPMAETAWFKNSYSLTSMTKGNSGGRSPCRSCSAAVSDRLA